MIIKESIFASEGEYGYAAIPLFTKADSAFEKQASSCLLPDIVRYIEKLKPATGSQYVLVNALGASEFYGSNSNGDAFPEASLIHRPDDWTGNSLVDSIRSKDWPYGYPTFYHAHPYAHHRNKDASRAYGVVELSAWNPKMRRVELVIRVDKDKCERFGGVSIWDKLNAGQFADVSMGARVPYDTCSICLDWKRYRDAQATFDPRKHKYPGEAVLAVHKKNPIRGVSITRKDYCEHTKTKMNKILSDGRKVFVYNDYPRFFDISFVFIGADKTAKVMLKIAGEGRTTDVADEVFFSSYEVAGENTASVADEVLKLAFLGKQAKIKKSEIIKDVRATLPARSARHMARHERHIPRNVLNALGKRPLEEALSTAAGMGIVIRPREFQRIVLVARGQAPLADYLDDKNLTFPGADHEESMTLGPAMFNPAMAQLLLPMMAVRSGMGPVLERRVMIMGGSNHPPLSKHSSLSSPLLNKMGAAYSGYRRSLMDFLAQTPSTLAHVGDAETAKLASAPVSDLFTPLSYDYFKNAFLDEVGGDSVVGEGNKLAGGQPPTWRGESLRGTRNQRW